LNRIIITGFSGFVSRHFLNYLYENKKEYQVLGADINEPKLDLEEYSDVLDITFKKCNMLDEEAVNEMVSEFAPDYILHLAAFSSVAYSWEHPAECFNNNTRIFLNLTNAVRSLKKKCRILSVGSSEEYGNVSKDQLPLKESMNLKPVSPYAVARVSQEMMSKVFVDSYDMDIVLTRSFNHMGPYQDERFVIPSFIRRILDVKEGGREIGTIETGDTTIIRDFVDVRDVVRAYYGLLMEGTPGEVYNICKGEGVALSEILGEISDIVGVDIVGKVNPEYVRPDDNRQIIGCSDKIKNDIGWEAEIPIRQTLTDMIEIMKNK
jgi:GDP-4-dehydro-6-deoxy-D-mannose reductase